MREVLIEVGTQVLFEALLLVVSVAFAFVGKWLAKHERLKTIAAAMEEVERRTRETVGELEQTTVETLKAQSIDGKLSKTDIEYLGQQLIEKVAAKMSVPAESTLRAAGVDIVELIHSAAESFIAEIKRYEPVLLGEAVEAPAEEPAAE